MQLLWLPAADGPQPAFSSLTEAEISVSDLIGASTSLSDLCRKNRQSERSEEEEEEEPGPKQLSMNRLTDDVAVACQCCQMFLKTDIWSSGFILNNMNPLNDTYRSSFLWFMSK